MHPELSLVQPTFACLAIGALAACFIVCLLLFHRRISATLRRRCADLEAALSERAARQQRDLAEFRRLEATLHQSETLITEVLNSLSAHIAVLDTRGVIVAVNTAWRRFAEQNGGASALCQVGSDYLVVCRNALAGRDDADARDALHGIHAVLDGKQIRFSMEYPCHSPTVPRWFEMRVYPLSGDRGGVVVAHEDITARKRAEIALRGQAEIQEQLAKIAATVPGVICSFRLRLDGSACFPYASPLFEDMYGLKPEDVVTDATPLFARIDPDDVAHVKETIAESARTLSPWRDEFRFRHPRKGERWIEGHSMPQVEPDGDILWQGFITDITDRKRAEEALWASEAKLKSIFRAAPVGIGLVGNRVFVEANDTLCQMTGYSRREMIGQSARLLYPTDQDYDYVGQEKYRQIAANGTGTVETRWRRKDGAIIDVLLSSTPLDTGDLAKGVTFTALDITDRKQAENALRVALTKYTTLFDSFPLGITVTDPAGNIVETNSISEQMLGIARAEHYQRDIDGPEWRIVRPDGTPMPTEEYASVRALRDHCLVANVEMGIVRPQGETIWLRVTAAPLPLEGYGVVIAYGDITEHKRAEGALRASEEKYRTVADFTHDWEYWIDPDGRYRYVSPSCERVTGFRSEELMSDPGMLMTIIHPDDRERIAAHLRNETSEAVDFRIITRDGREVWIGHVSRPVHGSDGRYLGRRGSNRDITKRKRMEVALRDSLAEKETLLREVHHRVKNNLTAIISLLELQRGTLADATSLALLHELGSRIRSMALVHEMLYQSNSLNKIDFQAYLRALVGFLRDSFDPHGAIRLDMAAPDVGMNLDTAIPCGLIVTELVINAIKYAFPEHRPHPEANTCEISVTAAWDGVTYSLVVADNGVGLPAGLDWTTTRTLGLRLVRMLGQHQLRGKLELDRTAGTRFSLRFGSIDHDGNTPHG